MNHHTAFQIDGGWRYASLSKRGGGPLGYCRDHDPHPTEDEARECFAQWLRDHVRLDRKSSNWNDCAICRGPAKNIADVEGSPYRMAVLCDEHNTKEHAITAMHLNQPAGDSWES